MYKIVVFGAGANGLKFINNKQEYFETLIIAVIDNNKNRWGDCLENYFVEPPQNINNKQYDYVVITTSNGDSKSSIRSQLKKMGVADEKIYDIEEYRRKVFVDNIYLTRNYLPKKKTTLNGKKIIIYSAIMGDYEGIKDIEKNWQQYDNIDVKYIFFTDNEKISSNTWDIRVIKDGSLSSRYLSKHIKLFPELYLEKCDYSIWVDGKFQIVGNLIEYLEQYLRNSTMLFFPHFARKDIYEEAKTCIEMGVGKKDDIIRQIEYYKSDGFPANSGLYEGGCIVRKYGDSEVEYLMKQWWDEIMKFSYRDQISLPYILWKNNFIPDISGEDLYNNKWLRCCRNFNIKEEIK